MKKGIMDVAWQVDKTCQIFHPSLMNCRKMRCLRSTVQVLFGDQTKIKDFSIRLEI